MVFTSLCGSPSAVSTTWNTKASDSNQEEGKMHENKHSCLERRLPGFCQMLRLSDPVMFCKRRCCRAKHLKLGGKNNKRIHRRRREQDLLDRVWRRRTRKGSFNMADVVTVAVEGQLAKRLC